jgi:hypothetical protein
MNFEKNSMKQIENSQEEEKRKLDETKVKRTQMEQELHDLNARKKPIDSIFKGIDHLAKKEQRCVENLDCP